MMVIIQDWLINPISPLISKAFFFFLSLGNLLSTRLSSTEAASKFGKNKKTKPHLLSALSSPITLLYFFRSQTSVSLSYCFSNLCAHTFPSVYLWSIRCGWPKQCHGCERHRESWRFIREAASPARNREQMLRNRARVFTVAERRFSLFSFLTWTCRFFRPPGCWAGAGPADRRRDWREGGHPGGHPRRERRSGSDRLVRGHLNAPSAFRQTWSSWRRLDPTRQAGRHIA